MSFQQELDKIESEIDKIRLDPKYVQLKNKKRTDFDTDRYTKYTRQLDRLDTQKKEVEKKMRDAGEKPKKRETEPGQYVERKPAWRNQAPAVARRNQNTREVSRNWVKDRKDKKEVATEFPAKKNAIEVAKATPETINYSKTSKTPSRIFVGKLLRYKKPVKRNASQITQLQEAEQKRLEQKIRPVNSATRAQPRLREPKKDPNEATRPAQAKKQPRKTVEKSSSGDEAPVEEDNVNDNVDNSGSEDLLDDLSN